MTDLNPFYHPERLGLEQVACFSLNDNAYEFAYRVVWRQKGTGRLLTASDSGCSCPTPFDGVGIDAMETFSLPAIEAEIEAACKEDRWASVDRGALRRELDRLRAAIEVRSEYCLGLGQCSPGRCKCWPASEDGREP